MINGVWIIKKETGVCIFNHQYEGKEVNPDLFSGFLTSIYSISEEITESGGIEKMELKDINLIYGLVSDLIFIIAATKDEDVDNCRKKLSNISKVFMDKYGEKLKKWRGEISIFEPFERDLNLIIEKMRPVNFVEAPLKLPQKKRLKLSEEEFQVLALCDGKTPIDVISGKTNISEFKLIRILKKFEKKKIIERKMIVKI